MIFCGIDNGTSGSIGIITPIGAEFYQTPTFTELSYTKKKQYVSRINVTSLKAILGFTNRDKVKLLLERPLVNSAMFKATQSAMRSLEATLIVLEELGIAYEYIDSKEWQKAVLPSGIKGRTELKKASLQVGKRLYPRLAEKFKDDADGMLIAHYCMLKYK